MKAAAYSQRGGPEVLEYQDVPDPQIDDRQILLEVEAIGIQGGDLITRQYVRPPHTPYVGGYQAAGVIRAIGADVTDLAVGDRAVSFMFAGSHGELAAADATTTWRLPDDLPATVAAAVPVEYGTAHDALFELGHLAAGETVLVQGGAGGVGLAAIQLAKAAGATVIATASGAERTARLRELGADHTIDYRAPDADVAAAVRDLTGGRGVELAIDPVGGSALEACIAAIAYRGRVVFLGQLSRDWSPPPLDPLMRKNGTLQGAFFGGEMEADPERTHALVGDLLARVARGELTPILDRTFPLADAAAAHDYIEQRRSFGRVILLP